MITSHDLRFINKAATIAKNNTYRWHLGAVIAKGSRFLYSHPNYLRNNPFVVPHHASVHAEEGAVKRALANGINLKGSTIYVVRYSNTDTLTMAKPCVNCMDLIIGSGIKYLWYSDWNGLFIKERVNNVARYRYLPRSATRFAKVSYPIVREKLSYLS